MMEES
jgi:hypothetical protein